MKWFYPKKSLKETVRYINAKMNSLISITWLAFITFASASSENGPKLSNVVNSLNLDEKKNEPLVVVIAVPKKNESISSTMPANESIAMRGLPSNNTKPVKLRKVDRRETAREVIDLVHSAALRSFNPSGGGGGGCKTGAIKVCIKSCKQAMKIGCATFNCKSKQKSAFKKACKMNCKAAFDEIMKDQNPCGTARR